MKNHGRGVLRGAILLSQMIGKEVQEYKILPHWFDANRLSFMTQPSFYNHYVLSELI